MNQRVLITAGASGIGLAVARAFTASGAGVIGSFRRITQERGTWI